MAVSGGEPRHVQVALDELDLGVGVGKQVVDQVLAVELVLRADAVFGIHQRGLDGVDGFEGVAGGRFDGREHVKHPVFPGVVLAHGLQQAVVVRLGAHDIAAQVEHGDVEQTFLDQVEDVDDAPGAAVAVVERVDALELVVDQRHFDERVGGEQFVVIDEAFEVAHERDDVVRVLRRGVDRLSGAVLQGCSRQFADTGVVLFQLGLDLDDVVGGEQTALVHLVEADAQGLAVTQHCSCRTKIDPLLKVMPTQN